MIASKPGTKHILFKVSILLCLINCQFGSHAQTYNLVWSDEFNSGIGPDWVFETGGGGWGNNEKQYYQAANATVSNGELVITAKKESVGGLPYTSARMKTQGKKSWKYGKIEARIKIPLGQGLWPAFWMLGDNISTVGWPFCGEIDILEHINTENIVYGTIHWDNNGHVDYGGNTTITTNDYHIYTIEWDANAIKWYVDGVKYHEANISNNVNGTDELHNNFFILLNLAVAGNWPGQTVDESKLPATMHIDYVKVYQLSGNPPDPNNLAINKPTTASSAENTSTPGSAAVDGNTSTRWSSLFSNPQWIYVDLGATYAINRVKITWEAALGKDYKIQVSSNASTWTDIKSVTGNTTLVNDWTGLSGTGRYVRVYGTARGTAYGYSIYELEVFGSQANSSPTASLTAPTNNTSYTAPATVTINASASDSDGTIAKVEFYQSATKLGEDTSSPYSYTWTGVAAGSYSLTAKATDNLGAATTSSAINITVSDPAAGLPAPWQSGDIGSVTALGSATYSSGTFTVKGSGADIWGTADGFHYVYQPINGNVEIVAKVNSLTNTNAWAKAGVMIRETLNANSTHASVLATPTTNGVSFQRRTTTGGTSASTTTAGVSIPVWVKISRTGNTFTASRSTDGTTWTTIGTATITMSASVFVGLPVTSHVNGTLTTATFSNVTVSGANAPPTASITSPANNASFTAPASITINATASDTDGTITKVDFYNGTTLLGTDTSIPYSYSWTNVAAGSYSLTAKATDNVGGTGTSTAVTITMNNPSNVNPTASITSPANNASFTAPASVTINATASDPDGTISKVDFYNGATLLGTDTSSPYSYSWTSVAAGTYALTAKATDNAGGTGTSSVVNITVTGGSDACSTTPQYVENGGYVAGSQVKNVGSKYECKPHPFSGWCNGAAWAYAPGTGTYWQDAWILVGSCTGGAGARTATQHVASNELLESEIFSTDADGLSLSPNPGVSNKEHFITLTFETEPGRLKINLKNINGTEVFSSHYGDVKSKMIKVAVPLLPQGLYILKVRNEKKSWMKKYLVR